MDLRTLYKPTPRKLALLASLLWLIAGANVLRIGLTTWHTIGSSYAVLLWLIGSLGFFSLRIFPRVVQRNRAYTRQIPIEALRWHHCFSPSSWLLMVGMIALGLTVRLLHLAPESFIAGFYTGLGTSLMQASLPYLTSLRSPDR